MAATGVILFSSKAVLVKLAFRYGIDSVSLLMLRMGFALPFYLGIWASNQNKWKEKPLPKTHIYGIIATGILGYYLSSYLDFKGLTYISASLERLILFSYPTFVLVFTAIILKKRISTSKVLSILVTYIGLYVILMGKGGITTGNSQSLTLGTFFVMLSSVTYASYLVSSNFLIGKIGSVRYTTYTLTVACIAVIMHYSIMGKTDIFSYSYEVYILGFVMAIFATVIPTFLLNEAISQIGAADVSIMGSIGPVSTIILSMLFLGERLTILQGAGAVIIIIGVSFITSAKAK